MTSLPGADASTTIRRWPLLRSSLGLAVSRAIAGGLLVLLSIVIARLAGPAALGTFGLAFTIGLYAWVIADLGVSAYMVPALARAPRDRWPAIWADVVRFELRSAIPLAVVYVVAVALLTNGSTRLALLAATPWWLLFRFNYAARSAFIVTERVGAEARATIAEAAVSLVAATLVLLRSDSAALAILCLSVGAGVGLAIRLFGLRKLGFAGGRSERSVRALVHEARPFAGFTILSTVYLRIDIVLLSLLASAREVGLYQPAVRFAVALMILPDALAAILLARVSREPEARTVKRRQEQVLALAMPIGLATAALCVLGGEAVLGALYGEEFREAWLALTLLVAAVPVALLATVNGNVLTARGLQTTRVACLLVAVVVAVGAGIPAIAAWGYNGAAAVTLLNEFVLAAAYAVALTVKVGPSTLVLPRLRLA